MRQNSSTPGTPTESSAFTAGMLSELASATRSGCTPWVPWS